MKGGAGRKRQSLLFDMCGLEKWVSWFEPRAQRRCAGGLVKGQKKGAML